ncbi:MAG: membrane protein insertase YidC [Spirochaetaceae bacterium]|jgi:YidC/Oxa1 family membrane protein insertase|nr:membrane protein insertase YidC [Spirochaetaceae bacterium]
MLDLLYHIIIGPIELILEILFGLFILVIRNNHGAAILGISVIVSFFCLPLYIKAESLQEKERAVQKKLAGKTAAIKRCFKGDERYMILAMYYRENHYHPIMALRSSLSLLIQIPFFIAAYHFLSHLAVLKGEPFLFIRDLGSPDALIKTGALTINLLPVLMTAINIVSGIIYTRGFPLKEKVQLYAMALVFLVLLYNSPAALVIYWTSNNVFSLLKNVVYKFKHPLRILYGAVLGIMVLFCIYVGFFRLTGRSHRLLFPALAVFCTVFAGLIPLYIRIFNRIGKRFFPALRDKSGDMNILSILSSIAAGILCGVFIPFNVAASDPAEFSFLAANPSPFSVLLPSLFISLGIFTFWPLYVYSIAHKKVRALLSVFMVLIVLGGTINVFVFGGSYGMLSRELRFAGADFTGPAAFLALNTAALLAVTALVLFLFHAGKLRILSLCCIVVLTAVSGLSLLKALEIHRGFTAHSKTVKSNTELTGTREELEPAISLSRTGKNVFIIMLDKASGAYFPEILKERKELKSSFSGFVYYPNTLSFFRATILGAPPLFGGYEYTPEKLQDRRTESMVTKHNESYMVLPTLFKQLGYSVSVFDLPYFNYQNSMDINYFTSQGMKADNLDGKYNGVFIKELGNDAPRDQVKIDALLRHNFTMFGIFSIAPAALRKLIYDNGSYWASVKNSRLDVVTGSALRSYAVLHYLPRLTGYTEGGNTFTMMTANMAHDPSFLQYPDYTVNGEISDFGPDRFNGNILSFQYYHVNAASYILLEKWFDTLKEQGVYDNTRIIIVSDHAEVLTVPGGSLDRKYTSYNPILLFKDFNAQGDLRTDMAFMTNADTPSLAAAGLVEDPRNPFTGNPFTPEKAAGVNVFLGGSTQPQDFPGNDALDRVSSFYHVKDTIFDEKNWNKITKNY